MSYWNDYFSVLIVVTVAMIRDLITLAWNELWLFEIFVFNKLFLGSFRIGVSETLIIRSIALAYDQDPSLVAHRVMGTWDPYSTSFDDLLYAENSGDQDSKPYPFYLA